MKKLRIKIIMSLKIKKSKLSKLWPPLIIIEGFWRMGKTALIKELLKQEKFSLINEPYHLIETPNVNDPHQWYFTKHIERQKLARQLMKSGKKVIMERSVLSSIAFDYAQRGKVTKENESILKNLPELKQFPIIFLYAEKQFIKNATQKYSSRLPATIFYKDMVGYQQAEKFPWPV